MKRIKRTISILMCAALLLGLLPTVVLADGEDQGTQKTGTLTISVVKAENASVTVSYQFLNESGTSIGQSQTYSSPVEYASGTSKVVVSVSTEETLREVNLSGSLYNPPQSETLMTAFSGENKSYTFSLGGISDTIELTLNYTDTPINGGGSGDSGDEPQVNAGDIALTIENSQSGMVYYKIGESAENWTEITGNTFTLRASDELKDVQENTKIYFKATPNDGQKVDDGDGRNRVRYDDTDHNISHTDLENGTYYLTYDPAKTYSMQIAFMGSNNPGDSGDEPQVNAGDIALTIENSQSGAVYYKIGESAENWTEITGNTFTLRASDELKDVQENTKIYFKATPNDGQRVDDGDGQNRVHYDDTDHNISHTDLENGTYYLTYDPAKIYSMQIAFMASGGNTPTDQEGNLAQTVTLNVYQYEIDHDNGGYQALSQPADPTGFMIESFKLNGFECFLQQNATVTFVNGGYALNSGQKNTFSFRESFGGKAKAIYLIDVEDGKVTKIEGSDFTWNETAEEHNGRWELEVDPAESYNVAVVEGVSDDLTVIWTTDYDTAANWNPDGTFASGMYVEHGQIAVQTVVRDEETIYDADRTEGNADIGSITEKFGWVYLKRGDTVTLKLIPDYGYQLKSVGAVDASMTADENEVSTFTIENIQNNIHFSSVFEAKKDEIILGDGTSVTDASISNGQNAINSGNLKLTVADIADTENLSDELKNLGNDTLYLDMNLYHVVSKGTGNENWENQLENLEGKITVTLDVPAPASGNSYYIIREHGDGGSVTYDRIEVTFVPNANDPTKGTVTFETDKFSNYALAQEAATPSVPDNTPSTPSSPSNSTSTTTNPDGSTTTTVTNRTTGTVTETTISKPITDENGTTTQTVTKTVTTKDGAVTVTETVKASDTTGTTAAKVTETNAAGETTVTVEASVSGKAVTQAAASGAPVTLPVEVTATKSTETAPVVSVEVPASVSAEAPAKVEIPVENTTPGTVALLVHADRTEEIIKTSVPGENGVVLTLGGSATVKIVDNSKTFEDVHAAGHWADDAVTYVAAREIFSGTSTENAIFEPETAMTRGMLMTVLARFEGEDTTGGAIWYEKGMDWAVQSGVSDGTNPNANVTREQMAVMLYRYAGSPTSSHELTFPDAGNVSGYAVAAMRWAVENGLINGMDGTLNPQGSATRAQVATIFMRFCKNGVK